MHHHQTSDHHLKDQGVRQHRAGAVTVLLLLLLLTGGVVSDAVCRWRQVEQHQVEVLKHRLTERSQLRLHQTTFRQGKRNNVITIRLSCVHLAAGRVCLNIFTGSQHCLQNCVNLCSHFMKQMFDLDGKDRLISYLNTHRGSCSNPIIRVKHSNLQKPNISFRCRCLVWYQSGEEWCRSPVFGLQ